MLKSGEVTVKIGPSSISQEMKSRIDAFAYSIASDKLNKDYPTELGELALATTQKMDGNNADVVISDYSKHLMEMVLKKYGKDELQKLIKQITDSVEDFYN